MEIEYSSHFDRAFKKLPDGIQVLAEKREAIFRADPFDSRLKTHKLHGKYANFWSFSVDKKYRIVFRFVTKGKVVFLDADDHDLYR